MVTFEKEKLSLDIKIWKSSVFVYLGKSYARFLNLIGCLRDHFRYQFQISRFGRLPSVFQMSNKREGHLTPDHPAPV